MTNRETPRTLDELQAVEGDEDRALAATAYLNRVAEAQRQARDLRDHAILRLIAHYGPSEAARRAGLSLSTIKAISRFTRRNET